MKISGKNSRQFRRQTGSWWQPEVRSNPTARQASESVSQFLQNFHEYRDGTVHTLDGTEYKFNEWKRVFTLNSPQFDETFRQYNVMSLLALAPMIVMSPTNVFIIFSWNDALRFMIWNEKVRLAGRRSYHSPPTKDIFHQNNILYTSVPSRVWTVLSPCSWKFRQKLKIVSTPDGAVDAAVRRDRIQLPVGRRNSHTFCLHTLFKLSTLSMGHTIEYL